MEEKSLSLWTKNFTIITVGSLVSMMGNTVAGFAISLMVLDFTESTFLYTLFIVAYSLPKLIMPIIAGPYLDRFSRRKVIYVLDFISAAIYMAIYVLLDAGMFSYVPFLIICIIIGSIDSVYRVAYDSLYPTLVAKENYRKAYSISSMLNTLSMVVAPIATYSYEKMGSAAPLFLFNAATFFLAAVIETQIKTTETHIKAKTEGFSMTKYRKDFNDGLSYIKSEPGLLIITVYFFFMSFGGGTDSLALPYFKNHETYNVMTYMIVMAGGMVGRVVGGQIHYKWQMPTNKKFAIARLVYVLNIILGGMYLYMPDMWIMFGMMFMMGILGSTSYNIRIASTQTYVPDSHRARFNGTFLMMTNLGMIIGQLLAGVLGDMMSIRLVCVIYAGIQFVAYLFTMVRKGHHVKPIYNMEI